MKYFPKHPHPFQLSALACAALAASLAHAQSTGVTTQGNTGGLVIPSAAVINEGSVALTMGNYIEPQFGSYSKHQNFNMGVGLLPNFELFGRFAEYQNPLPNSTFNNGPRDISANIKLRLPEFWRGSPALAVGATDFAGGAHYFRSVYGVASDHIGNLNWSLGYAKGTGRGGVVANRTFNGVFAGGEYRLGDTGLSALAEYDGKTKHAGLRYVSSPISMLGDTQLGATLQTTAGALNTLAQKADRTSFAITAMIPFERIAQKAAKFKPETELALLDAPSSGMVATTADRLESLQRALAESGLERVRVGMQGGTIVAEYENNRYGQNEADALGIVLGLAAEYAPKDTQRVQAITLKAGLAAYATSVEVLAFRRFLRDAMAGGARSSLAVERAPSTDSIAWHQSEPGARNLARLEIKPDLALTVGTDLGAFDYSLAANTQSIIPLWKGAELYTSHIRNISNSANMDLGQGFASFRQRPGFKTIALQQSVWLGRHVFANAGVGRFNYDTNGVQAEATAFVPNRDDVLRIKAAKYTPKSFQTSAQATPLSATYRYVHSPSLWLEAGAQRYSDGTKGPSVVLTRWFGDVAMHLHYRKGGVAQFAGLEMSFPLTPRKGYEAAGISLGGTPQFTRGIRTRIADAASGGANIVDSAAVRDFALDYNSEQRQLNLGRQGLGYMAGQLDRMRESFYLHAAALAPK
jgi:Exopolysaccharide biosynthesis protein YbjH